MNCALCDNVSPERLEQEIKDKETCVVHTACVHKIGNTMDTLLRSLDEYEQREKVSCLWSAFILTELMEMAVAKKLALFGSTVPKTMDVADAQAKAWAEKILRTKVLADDAPPKESA